jgi:hypothetical protein
LKLNLHLIERVSNTSCMIVCTIFFLQPFHFVIMLCDSHKLRSSLILWLYSPPLWTILYICIYVIYATISQPCWHSRWCLLLILGTYIMRNKLTTDLLHFVYPHTHLLSSGQIITHMTTLPGFISKHIKQQLASRQCTTHYCFIYSDFVRILSSLQHESK